MAEGTRVRLRAPAALANALASYRLEGQAEEDEPAPADVERWQR